MDYEEGSFQEFTSHCHAVSAVEFSSSSHLPVLVSASQSYLHLWDILIGRKKLGKEK